MKENFFNPYTAENITVFWRKWHISLSLWLRDYIYIPMGGNRRGVINMYVFLFLTMLIGGIWHGANWKFIFWGCAHGMLLIVHKLFFKQSENPTRWAKVLGIAFTFHLVGILWIFFRASSFETAFESIQIMVTRLNPIDLIGFCYTRPEIIGLLVLSAFIVFLPWNLKQKLINRILSLPLYLWPIILLVALQLILQFRDNSIEPFIYFQF
jgi:D-alanyl-lipoteichoic acid acyltransferase DltB (MBOAT superfamily)